MYDANPLADTGWTRSGGYPTPHAGYMQWQESLSNATLKLPQIEVANIEIAALADLYQQQLAEICAEHSLLLEDQSKLAQLIAPFLDERGYVTGDFNETVLLLKQGLDLRLLEYEEDCRRIQQTERRLQRRIDDILLNYELLALEAQGLAESRLQEQVKNMRRVIRVLQSELDETRFQRDVYADETRRLRGICRFGHWVEDGYGVPEAAGDETGVLPEKHSNRTSQISPLLASSVRQSQRSHLPPTCLRAILRVSGVDDSTTKQHAAAMAFDKDTSKTSNRKHRSRTMETDASVEDEGKSKPVDSQGKTTSEPSLFQEVLAQLLGSPEGSRSPAHQRSTPAPVDAVLQPESEASVPQTSAGAGTSGRERTNGRHPTGVRRIRAATKDEGRIVPQRHDKIQQRQATRSREDPQRDFSAASGDSTVTVEKARPVYRRLTASAESRLAGVPVQTQESIEETRRAPGPRNDEFDRKTSEKEGGALASQVSSITAREDSSRTLEDYAAESRKNSALLDRDERGRTAAAKYTSPTRETLLRRAASSEESSTGWRQTGEERESKHYTLPRSAGGLLAERRSPTEEKSIRVAPSFGTDSLSSHDRTPSGFAHTTTRQDSVFTSEQATPPRASGISLYQQPSRGKGRNGALEAFPRRFQSRTLASPRLSRSSVASHAEGHHSEPGPAGESGGATPDLLLPAWRRTRTMRSPVSRRSVDSAPQSPCQSRIGAKRSSTSSVNEEHHFARWGHKEGLVEKDGRLARVTSAALLEHSGDINTPQSDGPLRADTLPGNVSPISRSSSVLSHSRRLTSPRSFAAPRASGSAAASTEFRF